jgi:hypothetical protein
MLQTHQDLPCRQLSLLARPIRAICPALGLQVLDFLGMNVADDMSEWKLANVKANQTVKGRGLTKKQLQSRYEIPLSEILTARVHVDF